MTENRNANLTICTDKMSFEDCELAIVHQAISQNEKIAKKELKKHLPIKPIIEILEEFLRRKQFICYGGLAINNILPKQDQFYDENEIPDYDFYSPHALDDAIELANIYYKQGYLDVEAKSGVHYGTFKVFVNFIPIADITYIHSNLFEAVKKESLKKNGIFYASPNFLRMNMFLELSRPAGDVSRWEKIIKRFNLLNKHYPIIDESLKHEICEKYIHKDSLGKRPLQFLKIYNVIRNIFVKEGCVFFGGYASSIYAKYAQNEEEKQRLLKYSQFDVLSLKAKETANNVVHQLHTIGIKHIRIKEHENIDEIIPRHYEIIIDFHRKPNVKQDTLTSFIPEFPFSTKQSRSSEVHSITIAYIYEPIACHSYNTIQWNGVNVNIATIDTILSFYLAFHFSKKSKVYHNRVICMASLLFQVEQNNRLNQQGVLQRFPTTCYGKQKTLQDIRTEKANKYREFILKSKSNIDTVREYNMWFLKYSPAKKDALHKPGLSTLGFLKLQFQSILDYLKQKKKLLNQKLGISEVDGTPKPMTEMQSIGVTDASTRTTFDSPLPNSYSDEHRNTSDTTTSTIPSSTIDDSNKSFISEGKEMRSVDSVQNTRMTLNERMDTIPQDVFIPTPDDYEIKRSHRNRSIGQKSRSHKNHTRRKNRMQYSQTSNITPGVPIFIPPT